MNRLNVSIDAAAYTRWLLADFPTAAEAKAALASILSEEVLTFKADAEEAAPRKAGRPFKAVHPKLSHLKMKAAHKLLFETELVQNNEIWEHPRTAKRPSGFAVDQNGMSTDEIRLNNDVVAILNECEGVPPMPRAE